ncbi:MAG: class III lanthionine synthetase LanKC [Propionibacteriaceae bacterium]|nr:class III lanthionine synthetase LanKC [Propionibacteriaceae bacterium]
MSVRPEYVLAASDESPFYGQMRSMAQLLARGGEQRFQTAELPPGWLVRRWGGWEGWTPRDWQPRLQGWKIHVSATPDCAAETLARTTALCVERMVAFKFLPDLSGLVDTNAKQQDRGGSGKFITIYPDDDEGFAGLLAALDEALAGQQGPYILSDLRYGDGPVYARYGGIMSMTFPDANDLPVSAIGAGAALGLVPDQRQPRFILPDGVELPECLAPAYARYRSSSPSRLQEFKAVSPLHFSNAGGVYKATLPDDTRRVLREARSHTGVDARRRDAVTRQRQEQAVLADLAGEPGVQQLVGSFWAWEHRYLELEYAEGTALTSWIVRNTPYASGPDGTECARYAERAVAVGAQVIEILDRVHDRGWCVGDLHPGNVLVDDADTVTLIDFEDATRCDAEPEVGFRVFEFCAPAALSSVEADWYAVSRSLMLMYVPEWEMEVAAPAFWEVALERTRRRFGDAAADQIEAVCARFPAVERHFLAAEVTVDTWPVPPAAGTVVPALDAGIEWSRRFSPTGSFPGDPAQSGDVSESFGYGRAGVVWTRARLGLPVPPADLASLEDAARRPVAEPGLYDGRAGIALALSDAGRTDPAVAAATSALVEARARRRLDLHGGLAGVVLAAIEVARAAGDEQLLAEALAANEALQRGVVPGSSGWAALTHRRGFAHGLSGLALVDVVAHLAGAGAEVVDRAIGRVRADLDACLLTGAGDLMVRDNDNNRALPYIEWGSAGVWAVAQVLERVTGCRLLTDAEHAGAARACSADVYVYNCLDHGRAGIMAVLASAGPQHAAEALRQRDLVLANLLRVDDMAFVIGDGLIRLSSDVSTGAAGVALALACVGSGDDLAWLPVGAANSRYLSRLPAAGGPAWDPDPSGDRPLAAARA